MKEQTIRVLLVDDDQGDFEMTRAMMSQIETQELKLDWVSSFQEGMDALEAGGYDVYLIDYFLEDRTGMDLLREAGKRGIQAPLIMLTGRGNRQVDVQAMKAGAADYLVKGRIDPELLERSIRFALERSHSAQALRESEERHRGMFDHLPIGLYRCTPSGDFMDANPALVRLLGHPGRDEIQERYACNFYVAGSDRERLWNLLERYGVARGFESWIERADGTKIRVRNTARVHRRADREIEYVEGSVEDVTELEPGNGSGLGEARFRTLFHESDDGMALLDEDGLIVEANAAFEEAFGFSSGAAQGESFVDLAVEEERRSLLDRVGGLGADAGTRSVSEHRFETLDGTVLWARTKLAAVPGVEDGPGQILALLGDVSEAGVGG